MLKKGATVTGFHHSSRLLHGYRQVGQKLEGAVGVPTVPADGACNHEKRYLG